jgi:hypothetical protein
MSVPKATKHSYRNWVFLKIQGVSAKTGYPWRTRSDTSILDFT